MCIAGIVGIATRNSIKTSGSIAACVLYWIAAFMAYVGAGSYSDLKIWGFISLAFGFVFLLSIMDSRKSKLISTAATIVFLIILVAIGSSGDDASSASGSGDTQSNIVADETGSDIEDSETEADSDSADADAADADNGDDSDSNDDIATDENADEASSNDELETIEEQILLDKKE